ncbi:NAD(P)H-quinone oxidoreductase [Caballeronia zhejiangensis]|uniref:NAD(P)H-quinone oxidoreductase n=1 Tax=Caballeronia zhejiangensis TaxID=871203 RepID=A0A656QSQ8_9BURK|nr:NAD(P)H quinone oxidoreductase [Burkholderia sp. SJ98]KDR31979.1 NAD(P)H-quinone oxidoreductase [Caballeronia zhejiangensis]
MDSTYPLARATDAHRRMESSTNVGKIILSAATAISQA